MLCIIPPNTKKRTNKRARGTAKLKSRFFILRKTHFCSKTTMDNTRVYRMSFASVYPLYINKAERKGRTKAEVDEIVLWLTGYSQKQFEAQLENRKDFEAFFAEAPHLNASRTLIKGVICGIRVE